MPINKHHSTSSHLVYNLKSAAYRPSVLRLSNEEHQSPSNTLTHCAFRVSLNSRYVSNGPSTHPQCYFYSLSLYAL